MQTMISIFFRKLALATGLTLICTQPGMGQGLFSPAFKVDDQVVTHYEVNQRALFLQALRAPGDPRELAQKQLVEDRLKLRAAQALSIEVSESELLEGMEEFAGRANLNAEQFVTVLEQNGVEAQTFRDFVRAGMIWRQVIRTRFAGATQVSEAEVDRALSSGGGSSVRVLLAEIIMPAPPPQAQAVLARARRISQTTSELEFARAARQYSATKTARAGGKLPWQKIEDLPPILRPLVLQLGRGEVTAPIPIPNAVALFQLRAIEETAYSAPSYAAVEYAAYYVAGGRSEAALAKAGQIAARVDTCDDLYGVAKGQPEEVLERVALPPDDLPADIAMELAKLDPGETSSALTRSNGQTLVFLMLCGRTPAAAVDQDRDAVIAGLQGRRIQSLADSYLEDLRADARIVEFE